MEQGTSYTPRALAAVVALLALMAAGLVLSTGPFTDLTGPSEYALPGAIHGLFAFIYIVAGTINLYLAWRLYTGRIKAFEDLQLSSVVCAALAAITIVFGNWIYIYYRAPGPESPRSYFMATTPDVHRVWFEFKEFAALFTLPLSVAAAYILIVYGRRVLESRALRSAVAVLMALAFFFLTVAFGLGAAVTKLRAL